MALDWLPNTASQIDRALRAYFVGVTATTHEQTMIANDHRQRSLPLLDISTAFGDRNRATPSTLYSGSYDYPVDITAEFPASPEAGHPNPDLYSLEMDRFIGQITWLMDLRDPEGGYPTVCAAITAAGRALKTVGTTKSKAANTDMAEFTVQFIVPVAEHRVKVSDDGIFWMERRSYLITACSAGIS